MRLQRAQARQKPLAVILRDLRLQPFRRLEARVAQYQRLRKGERRFAHVQVIQITAEIGLVHADIEHARRVTQRQIFADRSGLRHARFTIDEQRHCAARIQLKERLVVGAWREGEHAQLVWHAKFFEHPENAEGTGAYAVVEDRH